MTTVVEKIQQIVASLVLVNPKEPIELAFEMEGVRYYQFVDPLKTPELEA